MPTIGQGLTMFGAGIGSALGSRRERKKWERLAELLAGAVKPGATGKAVSELAPLLAGVGQAMPIPEHMQEPTLATGPVGNQLFTGGMVQNALPFAPPQFTPGQQAQLRTPGAAAAQNATTAPLRAMLTSGIPQVQEMALGRMFGSEKQDEWARASDTIIFNKVDGSYRQLPTGTLKLRENEVVMRPNPETGQFEEVARGLPKATTPPKTKYVSAETSPGKYTLVPEDFAAAHGLTVKKDQQGISMGYDAEGRPTVQIGGVPSVASSQMSKPTQTAVETELLNAEKGLLRIDRILNSYDESYLNAPKQWQNWLRDKWERAGFSLSAAGEKELAGYATFESYTLENLNRYIKEITGAQMSEAEAERLMKSMPQMGEGKTRFRAKLLAIQAALKANHDAFYSALRRGESRERALAAADSASQDAYNFYVTKDGGNFFAGPKEMPAAPTGYQWQQREDGVNVLVRID